MSLFSIQELLQPSKWCTPPQRLKFESPLAREESDDARRARAARRREARMKSPDDTTTHIGGPYPEELLLEAYDLQWEAIELRHQRLRKIWQHILLMEKMDIEELRYKRQLRKLKRQELQKREREIAEREQAEALRRQRREEAALYREHERMEAKRQKKQKQVAVNGTQTDQMEPVQSRKKETKAVKPKVLKTKIEPAQRPTTKPVLPKRITPTSLPAIQPEDDESVSEENPSELGGYDSPPPELRGDGLMNMLSLGKGSDSDDVDDEPSMASLILPVVQEPPKRVQPSPLKKKMLTPQKRFARKNGGAPLDFNFTNAEARRQAKAAESAAPDEQEGSDERDSEPEPMPAPSSSTPKKRLKRRKDQNSSGATASGGKLPMTVMAHTTIAVKPKKAALNCVVVDKSKAIAADVNAMLKTTVRNKASRGPPTKTKPRLKTGKTPAEEDGQVMAPPTKKKVGGKGETMSIKQRLANAELLARMNKLQDMSTPKVLGKKTKKGQKQEAAKTLAAKRAEFRELLASDTTESDVPRRGHMIEEGDLSISLNSSGLISDNDSPEKLRAPSRKRPRGAVDGDVTPTKKLHFLEITKRLAKSPMPRYLRTPTPLMSPVVSSGLIKPKAASPGPRAASAHNTATPRRLTSAPVRPKKTTYANRFGTPAGGANSVASGGAFSMFDAFVNSGSSGAIPRLKTKTRGDAHPSV